MGEGSGRGQILHSLEAMGENLDSILRAVGYG